MAIRLTPYLLVALVLVACSTFQLPPPLNPETLPAELGVSNDISGAAEEFSIRLGIDLTDVIVRIQFRGCETCEVRQPPKQPPNLSLNEAIKQLQPNDKFWLFVPSMTCYYDYDGETVSPLACNVPKVDFVP